jgi:hypothetical protein
MRGNNGGTKKSKITFVVETRTHGFINRPGKSQNDSAEGTKKLSKHHLMNLYWNSTEFPNGFPFEPSISRKNRFFWMRKGKLSQALSVGDNFAASGGPFTKRHHAPAVQRILEGVRSLSRSRSALGERTASETKGGKCASEDGAMARSDGVLRESKCLRLRAGTGY